MHWPKEILELWNSQRYKIFFRSDYGDETTSQRYCAGFATDDKLHLEIGNAFGKVETLKVFSIV